MSSKIEVLNQRFMDPLNADPADIHVKDIAHALSMQCRFSGYTSRHYSVAEHSVYVAKITAMTLAKNFNLADAYVAMRHPVHKRTIRQALLHDATEAYLVDMPTPIKKAFPEFRAAEAKLWEVIADKFEVLHELHPIVKEVDGRLCTTEKMALLSDFISPAEWGDFFAKFPPYTGSLDLVDRYPVAPEQARRRFLDFFDMVAP